MVQIIVELFATSINNRRVKTDYGVFQLSYRGSFLILSAQALQVITLLCFGRIHTKHGNMVL